MGGQGGTDIYYTKKDASGQWGSLVNAGAIVNTSANELYPSFSEGELYFSSNGHPGLGGLDIYKAIFTNGKITSIENIGYPVNSNMDDMSYSKIGSKGYFVSNRYGSDDILSFDYKLVKILLKGKVELSDGSKPIIKVNLYNTTNTLLESVNTDLNGYYSLYVRPNRVFQIQAIEPKGNMANASIDSKSYSGNSSIGYSKSLNTIVINMPAPPPPVVEKVTFNNIIDSLKSLTDDYVIFHHDFDKVTLERSHRSSYKKLLSKARKLKGAKIVIVSAADCKGTDEYNEKLSARRATYLTKNIQSIARKNEYVSMHVGERILAEPCDEKASKEKQLENRYSYVFIIK
jgi:outer membrane protein OmpA-like peptidoglycan-associated protein